MKFKILKITIVILLFSCNCPVNKDKQKNNILLNDSSKIDSTSIKAKINPADIKQIFGYRFQITGDFDADGKQDTLREHFYSFRDKQETNKYFSGINDVWILYDSVNKRNCKSFMLCNHSKLDTVPIGGIFGPIFIKNEGDLDHDGGDEISFVPSLEQESSMNTCHILSFKKRKWMEIYNFEIREWQIPPLPDAGKTYGLFGTDGLYNTQADDSSNVQLQKQYDEFEGFITKRKSGKVEIQTFTSLAEDTTIIVDLSKHPKH